MSKERIYSVDTLPFNENLEKFAPPYTPEVFIEEEKPYLRPFFSNLNKPVFVTHNVPEEVNAALDSRYSRSTLSKRRLFLKEYIEPILKPEQQKGWKNKTKEEKNEARWMRRTLKSVIKSLNSGKTLDDVINLQRARKFFDKWLGGFGDDSIAEMGSGIHLSMEGVSSLVLEEVVSKRIGFSPLVKSTRYVSFEEKRPDGEYQYIVPGEIKGTAYEKEYVRAMDLLFSTYSKISGSYLEYIKSLYPKGEDETPDSFEKSRAAKRFDDIRDLLPFGTQNNMGLAGNGRAFEDIINRLLANPLGEARWWGKEMCLELEKVVPSFIERPKTERGAEIQLYRGNLGKLRKEMASEILEGVQVSETKRWATLISSTPEADVDIISTFLFTADKKISLKDIKDKVRAMTPEERYAVLGEILNERKFGKEEAVREKDRFKKVPRSFENAKYLFEIWGRGGDMRDLHRHRQLTEEHPPYTTAWGFDLEEEVLNSPFIDDVNRAFEAAHNIAIWLDRVYGPEVAQYVVPFGYLQHWYMDLSAREIYWIGELRTGPQGRPHYKEITLDVVDAAIKSDPGVFQGVLADRNDYRLARRESEKKLEKRLKQI